MKNEDKLKIALSTLEHIRDNVATCYGCKSKPNYDAELARHYEDLAKEALEVIQFPNEDTRQTTTVHEESAMAHRQSPIVGE